MPQSKLRRWNIDRSTIIKWKSTTDENDESNGDVNFGFVPLNRMPEFREKPEKINFGVETLDNLTRGGIDFCSLTQLYGEGGSGKTQICLQLALNVQLIPLKGHCVYIAAGKQFAAARIHQMAETMTQNVRDARHIKFLDNIHVMQAYNADLFENFIKDPDELETFLESQSKKVKLLIIDSIADIYRFDYDFKSRAVDMRDTITRLTDLAREYNFAVVCTNHAVDVFDDCEEEMMPLSNIKPALGLTWNSIVGTCLEVRRKGDTSIRELQLIQSPAALPLATEQFVIAEKGLSSV